MSQFQAGLSGHLDAAAPTIKNPFHYLAVVYAYLSSLAGSFVDTPEERAAIEATIMAKYDKIALTLMAVNPMLAGMFVAFRSTVKNLLGTIFLALTPPPPPTAGPTPITIPPTGAVPSV